MRHFDHLPVQAQDEIFARPPERVDLGSPFAGVALGATLYTPANRDRLADALVNQRARGVVSMVLDLEDALPDHELAAGEANLVRALHEVRRTGLPVPLVFVRPRTSDQITRIAASVGDGIAGFALPKFDSIGAELLETVAHVQEHHGIMLRAMPILESRGVGYLETRREVLHDAMRLIEKHEDSVLCVRIGGTDLSGLFGLRRGPDTTLYDLAVVRDVIADIVNQFARADSPVTTVTGCVWEYFSPKNRVLKPQLRSSPFAVHGEAGNRLRDSLVSADADALVREVVLDKVNGLVGKTVIHPSHSPVVHSLLAVTAEEYEDAADVLAQDRSGALRSASRNKMNESRPHRTWAERVLQRAAAFGVLREGRTYADLLAAHREP